eukprot:8259322-Pyramimonas_sp.AAC.1
MPRHSLENSARGDAARDAICQVGSSLAKKSMRNPHQTKKSEHAKLWWLKLTILHVTARTCMCQLGSLRALCRPRLAGHGNAS